MKVMVKSEKNKIKIANALKEGLRKHRGAIKEIAERTGFSRQYVWCVLGGDYNNLSILKVAGIVFSEREAEKVKIVESIKQQLNSAS